MKIKILEYHQYKRGIVKVQSHNLRKGVWKINPNYSFHKSIAFQESKYDRGTFPIFFANETTKEVA